MPTQAHWNAFGEYISYATLTGFSTIRFRGWGHDRFEAKCSGRLQLKNLKHHWKRIEAEKLR